ncbi:MAG: cytochrome c oxidase subunit 3 [Chitinophagales bacterium]
MDLQRQRYRTNSNKERQTTEAPILRLPPAKIALYFFLTSITIFFFTFTVLYFFAQNLWTWTQFKFPKVFIISTFVLIASSYTISEAVKAFKTENSKRLQQMLWLSLILSIVFVAAQVWGWVILYDLGIYIDGKPDGSYLYLLSGLHALHVIVGVVILAFMIGKIHLKLQDSVDQLVYFTDSGQLMKLEMIATYWHFVDGLWLYLLFFLLFNHL